MGLADLEPTLNLSIRQSINQSVNQSINQSPLVCHHSIGDNIGCQKCLLVLSAITSVKPSTAADN